MEQEVIFTLPNVNYAIKGEQALLAADLPVKVMPLPSAIKAGCGICLRLPVSELKSGKAVLIQNNVLIDGIYIKTTENNKITYDPWEE